VAIVAPTESFKITLYLTPSSRNNPDAAGVVSGGIAVYQVI
jgi:hypothetical protein